MTETKKISKADRDALLAEYDQCFNNYSYRDQLVPTEFHYAIILTAGIVSVLETFGDDMGLLGKIIILILGLFMLLVLHYDLMANSSSKRTAIQRAKEIEKLLGYECNACKQVVQLAHRIGKRETSQVEKLFSKLAASSGLMILLVRVLTLAWLLYVVSVVRNHIVN